MQTNEYDQFVTLVRDLCTAFNRPFTDDVVRVFWESLRDQSLRTVRNRAELHRRVAKKFPMPFDLRPAVDVEVVDDHAKRGPTTQERLCEFAARKFHDRSGFRKDLITPLQYSMPWTYLYKNVQWYDKVRKRDRNEPAECVGVVIPAAADGSRPGYRIMAEDLQLENRVAA